MLLDSDPHASVSRARRRNERDSKSAARGHETRTGLSGRIGRSLFACMKGMWRLQSASRGEW